MIKLPKNLKPITNFSYLQNNFNLIIKDSLEKIISYINLYMKNYSEVLICDGILSEYIINHKLNDLNLHLTIRNNTNYQKITNYTEELIDNNNLKIVFSSIPTNGQQYLIYISK